MTNETHPQYQTSKYFGVINLGFIAIIAHQCSFLCELKSVFMYSCDLSFQLMLLSELNMSIKKEGKK